MRIRSGKRFFVFIVVVKLFFLFCICSFCMVLVIFWREEVKYFSLFRGFVILKMFFMFCSVGLKWFLNVFLEILLFCLLILFWFFESVFFNVVLWGWLFLILFGFLFVFYRLMILFMVNFMLFVGVLELRIVFILGLVCGWFVLGLLRGGWMFFVVMVFECLWIVLMYKFWNELIFCGKLFLKRLFILFCVIFFLLKLFKLLIML